MVARPTGTVISSTTASESSGSASPAGVPKESAPPAAAALVGRENELTAVRAAFDSARAGRPTIVLLTGEAGIGKTRLADEAAVIGRASGARVLRGEADALSREPMELWRGIYRGVGIVPAADPTLPVAERRWEHLESLADGLAAAAPALVVLEDLHWADPIAIWVLEHLPRALGDASIAVLATCRDNESEMTPLDTLRRVSTLVRLGGLDVEGVRQLVGAEIPDKTRVVDPVELCARTGGNPLFVQELLRSPGGSGLIGEVLARSLDRFDVDSRDALAIAAVAGTGTPLSILAVACSCPADVLAGRLQPAVRAGVLDQVSASGVRFHHALLAEAAGRLGDARNLSHRLASAWQTVGGLDGRAAAALHRMRAAATTPDQANSILSIRDVAAELVATGNQSRAASLLWEAHSVGAELVENVVETGALRANVALDLADVLSSLGDLGPALTLYEQAAELAREGSDPITRARAEVGANLFANAFVPDLPRMRRLQDALENLPAEELHLRATLLSRLAIVGGADIDATDRVRVWAQEAVEVARSTGDSVLIAQSLLDQNQSPTTPAALAASIVGAEEVIRLGERVGRSDLALSGHQRRAGYHLNRGDLGTANQALGRAEVLAALQPSPWWRYSTMLQRTTILALSGSRSAAAASMEQAVQVGTGHVEPVVVVGCEALHQLMLFDLYGYSTARTQEIHQITMEMLKDVPSPVFQVQKGFGAQLFGDLSTVQEVLHRFGSRPELLIRSMTGDHLLRDFADMVARAGAKAYALPAYLALLPYAGLLNVAGGHSAGLPVDDVLGRLAALNGDVPTAVRHTADAVALARSMPSPPLLVHCLDHLADTLERAGDSDLIGALRFGPDEGGAGNPDVFRAEADSLAATTGVVRPGRQTGSPREASDSPKRASSMRRDGPIWMVASPLGGARLPDSNGLRQLARLLSMPAVEVTAVELAGHTNGPIAGDLGPGLDARAKRDYRRRLHDLQAEVDSAESAHDLVRAERAHIEMESLLRELKRAVGLGGRDRPTGSDAERARINVVRSIRRTIEAIDRQAPLLGAHLQEAVRTGRHCIYLPEPDIALSWAVSAGDTSPS